MAIQRIEAVLAVVGGLMLGSSPALAGEAKVAVAANFTQPAQAIATAFKAATGHETVLSFGSSGQFLAQIKQGAPYEVFLSADSERPALAEKEGLSVRGSRFTYAVGQLVLYSKTPGLVDANGSVLANGAFGKLAIADPALAPYGVAAVEALRKRGLYERLEPKIVKGASVTQAYQFVQTGAAELGFVAYAQVIGEKGGSLWRVPAAYHTPIDQQAVLLKTGENDPAAKAFIAFLRSPKARAIIHRYGYEVR